MNINLHIERLVLEGLPVTGCQSDAVGAGVQIELARILAERGLPRIPGGVVPRLSVDPLNLRANSTAAQLGSGIAQTLGDGLAPQPRNKRT
jgi:hypothetical protein